MVVLHVDRIDDAIYDSVLMVWDDETPNKNNEERKYKLRCSKCVWLVNNQIHLIKIGFESTTMKSNFELAALDLRKIC